MIDEVAQARFWSYIRKTDSCWEWHGAPNNKGYGQFGVGKRKYNAHRLAYELVRGAVPLGKILLHSCGNNRCCNPDHLVPGTNSDRWRLIARRRYENAYKALTVSAVEPVGMKRISWTDKPDSSTALYNVRILASSVRYDAK